MPIKPITDPEPRPGYEWCAPRECWVHEDVCRNNAYQRGVRRCLACRQLPLFDPCEIQFVRGKVGRRIAPESSRGGPLKKGRGSKAGRGRR